MSLSESTGRKICRIFFAVGLVLLSTILTWFVDGRNKNILLLVYMALSPLILIVPACRIRIPKIDLPLALFTLFSGFAIFVWHPEHLRIGTWLFSITFCIFFSMMVRALHAAEFSQQQFLKIIRTIIYLFAGVLLIQQICVLLGLPVFNQTYQYNNPYKLNSLTREPSYLATISGMLMFFYSLVTNYCGATSGKGLLSEIRRNPWLWSAYIWTLFSCYSASSYVAFPLSLTPWIRRSNFRYVIYAMVICFTTVLLLQQVYPLKQMDRAMKAVPAVLSLNAEKIKEADLCAAERVVPVLTIAGDLHPTEADFWLGHGNDRAHQYIQPTPLRTETDPYVFNVWYNYGFLSELALLWLIAAVCFIPRRPISYLVSLAAVIYIAYNNCSAIWIILSCMAAFRYLYSQQKSEKVSSPSSLFFA